MTFLQPRFPRIGPAGDGPRAIYCAQSGMGKTLDPSDAAPRGQQRSAPAQSSSVSQSPWPTAQGAPAVHPSLPSPTAAAGDVQAST